MEGAGQDGEMTHTGNIGVIASIKEVRNERVKGPTMFFDAEADGHEVAELVVLVLDMVMGFVAIEALTINDGGGGVLSASICRDVGDVL